MLTQERLKELLSYEPETGIFRWLVQRGSRGGKGSQAGSLDNGYILIGLDKHNYPAHRLAWLYVKGTWPAYGVDHKDMDKTNNRFTNLREATATQNSYNREKRSNNSSGYKGVSLQRGKFLARCQSDGKSTSLGLFPTAELASEAYQTYAKVHHGEFYRA